MSECCFKISGEYRQYHEPFVSKSNRSFVGYMIVRGNCVLEGYIDESSEYPQQISKTSVFLTGRCVMNSVRIDERLVFYELSANDKLKPILCIFLESLSEGGRFRLDEDHFAAIIGKMELRTEAVEATSEILNRINSAKEEIVSRGPVWNRDFVSKSAQL